MSRESQDALRDPSTLFGGIDIYLLDQVLRRRITPEMRVFDAGCGRGRNLEYFLRAGYAVGGVDLDGAAIESVRELAREFSADPGGIRCEPLEESTEPEGSSSVVVCNAVLHFAHDDEHFEAMLQGAWRALKKGGLFFARLASSIGIEDRVRPIAPGRFALPDGSERYLVDEERLLALTRELGGELLDPLKTTNVQNLRCMSTWVLRKVR